MSSLSKYDPPDPATLGPDQPKVRDLIGFVVACVGARPDVATTTDKGEQDVVRLDRLVVFEANKSKVSGIEGIAYPDYIIWQKKIQQALEASGPVVIGRITRPDQAFLLEVIPDEKKEVVEAELIANGWMPQARTSARPAQQDSRDDGGDAF